MPAPVPAEPVVGITPPELSALLAKRSRGEVDFLLIDVREPAEHAEQSIEGAVLIPAGEIRDGSAIGRLPRQTPIILHCHSGRRSAECAAVLMDAKFTGISHLEGGIVRWLELVDPSRRSRED